MILPDWIINYLGKRGTIEPFNEAQINPCSYDMKLGDHLITLDDGKDGYLSNTDNRYLLLPGKPILATTMEVITIPRWCYGTVYLKSSAARSGLDHALAGWVDAGFSGQLTLEFHAHKPVELLLGKCYCQIVIGMLLLPPMKPYGQTGRYQNQKGATRAILNRRDK